MEKKFVLVSGEGWLNEWKRFVSKGRECFSYMMSWNEKDRLLLTMEEARSIQSLFPYPIRIQELA